MPEAGSSPRVSPCRSRVASVRPIIRRLATPVGLGLAAWALLGASPGREAQGIVVENVVQGSAGEKPRIEPGDILISWKRPSNPPANPTGASGNFRTPFDLLETCIRQAPRAKALTLTLTRNGERLTAAISELGCEIETRPAFRGSRLAQYEEGRRLIAEGDLAKGVEAWEALASEVSASGDSLTGAWVWLRIATRQASVGRIDAAAASMDLAIAQARLANRPDVEAQLWGLKGEGILAAAKKFKEGEAALRQALAIRERLAPDSLEVAHSLSALNSVTEPRGAVYEAEQSRVLRIAQRHGPGSALEADTLNSLGTVTAWRGETRAGVALERRALAVSQALDPHSGIVLLYLNNLCASELDNDLAAADSYCTRLIAKARRRPAEEQPRWIALADHNMAYASLYRGDLENAARLLREALAIREATAPGSRGLAMNLEALGQIEVRRGNLAEAEELIRRAGAIHEAVAQLNSPYKSLSLVSLAEISFLRRDLPTALHRLREAAVVWEKLAPDGPSAAGVYDDMGQVLAALGEAPEAEAQFRRALKIRRRSSPGGSRNTAESGHNLGMLLWETGRLTEAEVELRRSIEDLEAQQEKLGGSAESRSVFTAEFADYYRDYVRLLVEMHREQDAFSILERFRAGAFLRTLAQRDLAAPEEVPAELESGRRQTNAEYDHTQARIDELSPARDTIEMETSLARLGELRRKQSDVADRIRKASPRYGALRYPEPLDLAGARAVLDPGTLLLSYLIGKDRSYVFAVTKGPPGLSVYTLPIGERELRQAVDAFRRQIGWKAATSELAARSRALYDLLLAPAEDRVAASDRLLILPDGPLHTIPWSALMRGGAPADSRYLVEWKPIHTAASATVYAELEKRRGGRQTAAPIELAAFGDPRYPATLTARKGVGTRGGDEQPEAEFGGDPELEAVARGGHRFEPLPRSREEVEAIARLYAPKSQAYLGVQATEERARSVGEDVALIHYACHAYVDERFPLDSALVFTIPERPREGQDNGILQAWEIVEKMRIDADLVTLSACESGLGKEMGGEGLIGLTRAFQYAGARSVLASLWKVEDDATERLMKRFYGYLKAGKTKDEALRLAQIDLLRSSDHSRPREWAAFQLNGDWK